MFLHGMGSGSCLSYTGLVLPEHTNPQSELVFLNDSQVKHWSYPMLPLNSVSVQANWFVSVSPLAFCLGVLLSIVASERLGRLTTEKHMSSLKYCNHLTNLGTNSLARKDDHVNSWQFHQVWGFQEDDVCPEQFHSTTLLCSSLFCSKFLSLVRWD